MKRGMKRVFAGSVLSAVSLLGAGSLGGCSMDGTIGAYSHTDMSNSRYREIIKNKADELSKKPDRTDRDIRAAVELYGSAGELEEMDEVVIEYFNRDPRSGLIEMRKAEKIHEFYDRTRDFGR